MRNVLNLSISFVKFPLGSGIPRMSSSSSSKAFGALTINCMVLEVVLMEVQRRNFKYFNLVTDNVEMSVIPETSPRSKYIKFGNKDSSL